MVRLPPAPPLPKLKHPFISRPGASVGLDTVEFVMALEDRFEMAILDRDAEGLLTPRHVVEFLESRLLGALEPRCLEQRAFHRLRKAGMTTLGRARDEFRPDRRWDELLPEDEMEAQTRWTAFRAAADAESLPSPSLGRIHFGAATIRGTCEDIVIREPGLVRAPTEGWTRREIEKIVTALMAEELGIMEFRWDQTWRELGVD